MNPSTGLMNALNYIRETSIENGTLYHKQVPVVDVNTSIQAFGQPILENQSIMNEFISTLMNRIAYTSFSNRYEFDNPLRILKGDEIPLGSTVQDIYVNPAKAREYNVNDFAGLLVKYEADVKVQYLPKNSDLQYPVSITRPSLKKAFTSWGDLERFIDELANSLYNGAYIDEFRLTKGLVKSAYDINSGAVEVVSVPTSEAEAKSLVTQLRTLFLNMGLPSTRFNAWAKVGGNGNAVETWTRPEDIVLLIRNDLLAYLDVEVMARAFNLSSTQLLGQVIAVDSFGDDRIVGFIGDRRWFRINDQEMYLDEFYNANNRVWNYYLNKISSYNYSLFANGVILATEEVQVEITEMAFAEESVALSVNAPQVVKITTTPATGNTEITYKSSSNAITITKIDNKTISIVASEAVASATITATAGSVKATLSVSAS